MKLSGADPKIQHVKELTFNPQVMGELLRDFFNGEGTESDTDFR